VHRSSFVIVLVVAVVATSAPTQARSMHPAAAPNGQPPAISGAVQLASTSSSGGTANNNTSATGISASGDRVTLVTTATNLDPDDTDDTRDVYVKDVSTGELFLASITDAGIKGNGTSEYGAISGDGGTVAFRSFATNLDPADTDALGDVYVKDLDTGQLMLASTSDTGVKGDRDAGAFDNMGLARQGNRVVFSSSADNLDPADPDTTEDVFVKKLVAGDLVLVSTSSGGVKGNGLSRRPAISASGTTVAFESVATNLDPGDTDVKSDVYVKTLATGQLVLASVTLGGRKGNSLSMDASISGGGNKVAFSSKSTNLSPADTDAGDDIYVKNLVNGTLKLVSLSDDHVKANGDSVHPQISGDGKRVLFYSIATNLDPAATDGKGHLYVKDLQTGDLSLVDASPDGAVGGAHSVYASINGGGEAVAFSSFSDDLSPDDPDIILDAFVKEPLLCTAIGTSGNDTINGTPGADVLCGRGGNDVLHGMGGTDTLFGEDGIDVLDGGSAGDGLDGGSGDDWLNYEGSGSGVSIDLDAGTALGGDADGDRFASIVNVTGSDLGDTLTGDGGTNNIDALGGDDVLSGGGGSDSLLGDADIDILDYQTSPAPVNIDLAADTASGGDATGDLIDSIEGVIGSAFDDTLRGDNRDNFFLGMGGGDAIAGDLGVDLANYLPSPAGVTVNLAKGTSSGGDAQGDVLTGIENVAGSDFPDSLVGNGDSNTLFGNGDDDDLKGKSGTDTLFGGSGTDTFDGGGGTDTCDDVAGETAIACEV
jgi:hypothetical protein